MRSGGSASYSTQHFVDYYPPDVLCNSQRYFAVFRCAQSIVKYKHGRRLLGLMSIIKQPGKLNMDYATVLEAYQTAAASSIPSTNHPPNPTPRLVSPSQWRAYIIAVISNMRPIHIVKIAPFNIPKLHTHTHMSVFREYGEW